ncbi:MAG: flagellar biosynthesis/type III secretory pathway protein [Lachnospiraceae bacterium]|nr:flagellar biosynthesis/type III secretory pathway protein [Lachnospiraceae bacterium]
MAEATAKGEAEEASRRAAFEQEKAQLEEEYRNRLEEMEPQVVSVVADIFEKVFSIQFEGKKEIILNLVRNAVDGIENSKEFLIKVPKENLQFIMEHKEELQDKVGQYVSIEIISDGELTDNQCIIETDSGVFDCSLDIQLENLVRDIKSLSVTARSDS